MSSPCHFLIENARTCHLGVDLANTWQFKDALPDFPTLRERMKNKWWFQTECPFCTFILSCLIVMIQTGHFTERNFSDSSQTLSNSTGTCHINLVGPSTFGRSRLHEFSSGKLSQWNYDHCREIATIYLNLDFLPRYGKRLSRECPIILLPEGLWLDSPQSMSR
jgi:hypothetical protein